MSIGRSLNCQNEWEFLFRAKEGSSAQTSRLVLLSLRLDSPDLETDSCVGMTLVGDVKYAWMDNLRSLVRNMFVLG
jgi:hypothetical protein